MGIDFSFWEGKKVLITGHTGFKGSWLSLWLNELGAKVIGYSLEPVTTPSLFERAGVNDCMHSYFGNVLDMEKLKSIIVHHEPEIIFHLAAQSLVKKSYEAPKETIEINIMGTVNVFEAVRQTESVKAIVNVTSDKCYENRELPFWGYRENDRIGGDDPYSVSKGCAELITSSYQKSFFNEESNVQLASVRAGNVIGGGDWAENRLIPDIIRSLESSIPLTIRNPNAVRPWQHVLEPLLGYIHLAEKLFSTNHAFDEGWNFGPKNEGVVSVKELLLLFSKELKKELPVTYPNKVPFKEAAILNLDCSKAFHKLKWRPRLNLNETVRWTSQWYERYLNGVDMKEFTIKQIHEYMALAKGD